MSSPTATNESPLATESLQTKSLLPDVKSSAPEPKKNEDKPELPKKYPPEHVLGSESISKDLLQNVQPSEVKILETLRDIEHCAISVVEIRSIACVMKVHHGVTKQMQRDGQDHFMGELDAYRHLKKHGFCDEKVVPDFYGVILDMKSEDWPDWQIYHREKAYGDFEEVRGLPGDAILMEYIPDMQQLTMTNYTPHRVETWTKLIERFHAVDLTHGDAYPRNMMFVEDENGNDERIPWLDFERGCVYKIDRTAESNPLQRERDTEAAIMNEFGPAMAIDATEHGGKVVETRHWWEW